jgi:hypothetical protein
LSVIYNKTGDFTTRIGNLSSAFKKAENQWKQKFKCRLEIWQKIQRSIISPICFPPYHKEKKYLISEPSYLNQGKYFFQNI